MGSVTTREWLLAQRSEYKRQGILVGFTSGTFDLLHSGHLEYLKEAKKHCDILLVGVNSDSSVRTYKDPQRPILPQAERVALVGALQMVDYAFVFDETNNNQNISLLKPDLYLKAGDYTHSQLSSAPMVEAYGGKVEILPFLQGRSTTQIIQSIQGRWRTEEGDEVPLVSRPAVFLDRDGTLNEHIEYLHEPDKFQLLPGVLEGLKALKDAGYSLVVITNQPGIGLGYFTKEDFFRVNHKLLKVLSDGGVLLDKIYFCPHSKSLQCDCRKPNLGLFRRAVSELNVDLQKSYMIGDMSSDMEAAHRLGIPGILVNTGKGGADALFDVTPDFTASSFLEASHFIIEAQKVQQRNESV